MKLFRSIELAKKSLNDKKILYVNSICPFNTDTLCSSECALFFIGKNTPEGNYYIMLGCKGSDKHLYIDEIIED